MIQITQTNHIEEEENEEIVREPDEETQESATEKFDDNYKPELILTDMYLNNANDLTNFQLQLKDVVEKIRSIDEEETDYGKGCLNTSCPNQRKSDMFDSLLDAVEKIEKSHQLENEALKIQIRDNIEPEQFEKIALKIEENKKIKELHARIKIYDESHKQLKESQRKLKGRISTLVQKCKFKEVWERDKEYKRIVEKIRARNEDLQKVSSKVFKKKSDVKALNVQITRLHEEVRLIENARNQILTDTKVTGEKLEKLQDEAAKVEARMALSAVKVPGMRKPVKRTVAVARQPSIIEKGKLMIKKLGDKYRKIIK